MISVNQIDQEIKASMQAGDADRTGALRLIKNALKNEQIKLGHDLSDQEALKVLKREAKQRQDSIAAYEQAGRQELAAAEQAELAVIEQYLPQQMSEEELKQIIDEVITETGTNDIKGMGLVIGQVMQRAGAQADGAAVSRLVKEKLA